MTDAQLMDVIGKFCGLFVSGGLGDYLGSYLKKKGENLATREDLDKPIVQVSAVTAATQRIEARTTRSLRIHERQLDILAKLYRHLNDAQSRFQNMTRGSRLEGEKEPKEYAPLLERSMKAA